MDDLLAMQVLILRPANPATGQDEPQVTAAAGRAFARQAEKLAELAAQSIRKTAEAEKPAVPVFRAHQQTGLDNEPCWCGNQHEY
jgi:hypothetical protein